MRTVIIDTSVTTIRGFKTAGEAIRYADDVNRASCAKADSLRIRDRFVTSYAITQEQIRVRLSGDLVLDFVICGKAPDLLVDWRLSMFDESGPDISDSNDAPMTLIYPKGLQSIWNPAALIEKHRHAPLKMLFRGDFFVNLYFEKSGALMFIPCWNSTDNVPILTCSELEPFPKHRTSRLE